MATRAQTTQLDAVTGRDYPRIGWTISGLVIAFLLMDATMKLLALPIVLEAGAPLGFPGAGMARGLGTVLLICTLLYAKESPVFGIFWQHTKTITFGRSQRNCWHIASGEASSITISPPSARLHAKARRVIIDGRR